MNLLNAFMKNSPIAFPLGQIVMTPGVLDLTADGDIRPLDLIRRHAQGDWGDMCQEDQDANNYALKEGGRLFSSYNYPDGKVWIITEADHSATTLLLPSEY